MVGFVSLTPRTKIKMNNYLAWLKRDSPVPFSAASVTVQVVNGNSWFQAVDTTGNVVAMFPFTEVQGITFAPNLTT